jgi:hypothetical protein
VTTLAAPGASAPVARAIALAIFSPPRPDGSMGFEYRVAEQNDMPRHHLLSDRHIRM